MKKNTVLCFVVISFLTACKGQEEFKNGTYAFLSTTELSLKSQKELRFLRNEVYARKGYVFKSEDLQTHFSKQVWYHAAAKNNMIVLDEKEKEYIDVIKEFEQQ